MKNAISIMLLALALTTGAEAQQQTGPFGFWAGMSKAEVKALVGSAAVKEVDNNVLQLTKAPKPHPDFELYTLFFDDDQRLVKITASTINITTNGYGAELSSKKLEIEAAVSGVYGKPSDSWDHLRAGSIWDEPKDWMMGLLKKERMCDAYWLSKDADDRVREFPNKITAIALSAVALNSEVGYLSLGYEFEGFTKWAEAKKAKNNTVF